MITYFRERQRIKRKKRNVEHLSSSSLIDLNCVFDDSTVLEGYNVVGKNVNICSSEIGLGTIVGNNCQLSNCKIGRFCSIGTNINVVSATHPTNLVSTNPCFYQTVNNYPLGKGKIIFNEFLKCNNGFSVNFGNDVWVGNNVLIKGGVTIGDGSVVAMGAVVIKDVPSYAIVGGVPAKIIRFRFEKNIINDFQNIKWWDWDLNKILAERDLFGDVAAFLEKNRK